ncbi:MULTISPECIES: ATP-binding cassette domain-containing protein [unclassified Ligilactobacillus]|uniref:ABC-F family ATP-binding cassette domain-containing protein n=1 Tax=unclassified Ligilactobacillus TaxID=2767920 RepID=UPI0038518C90
MILLQAQKVARHFGADTLFHNVNLDIQDGDRIALVGRNGAGKSTLIKMLTGEAEPDEGQIIRRKDLTIGYLAQNAGLSSGRTLYDEMLSVFAPLQKMEAEIHQLEEQIANPPTDPTAPQYQQLLNHYDQLQHDFKEQNGYGYETEIKSVLTGFKFFSEDYDRPVDTLSGGQKTRLALAKLLLEKRDLLILDEPTNHLDIATLTWLENYIQSYQGALLIVSHDRYFLDRIVNQVYEIENGTSTHYTGNYSQYVKERANRQKAAWKAYEKQQAKIHEMEEFVNKNIVRASTTKRAQSRRKQLEKMERLDKPASSERTMRFTFTPEKESGNIVLTVKDAAIGYNGHQLAAPIDFELKKHQVLTIVGPNGTGKSTLLKSILGIIPFIHGSATRGTNVTVGYYDQEHQVLHADKTVLDEVWDDHRTMLERDIRSVLGSFLFSGDDVQKKVVNLSGGEKARLLLTKLALNHDNLLVLDEPTNHLDIESKEVLEQAVKDFSGTVLMVSHDRYFINQVTTNVLELAPTGSTLYLGDYDYYVQKRDEQAHLQAAQAKEVAPAFKATTPATNSKQDFATQKAQQRAHRKLERAVQQAEKQMATLEAQKDELEKEMATHSNDLGKLTDLQKQLDTIVPQLKEAEQEWEEAALALEEDEQ